MPILELLVNTLEMQSNFLSKNKSIHLFLSNFSLIDLENIIYMKN